MFLEVLGSVLIGLVMIPAAFRLLPGRIAAKRLAAATSVTGALLGSLITSWVVGAAAPAAPLVAAVVVGAAGISLLVEKADPAEVRARAAARTTHRTRRTSRPGIV